MQDELRPISCTGHDSQGGVALTLIDALDSLVVGCRLAASCNNIYVGLTV